MGTPNRETKSMGFRVERFSGGNPQNIVAT